MKIISKSNLEPLLFPLPIYKTIKIGEAASKDGNSFSIFVGLNEKMVAQLKVLSLDKSDVEIQKNTSDKKRFGEQSYEDWYKKNRTPFVLVHTATNALAALVWFGPEPLEKKEGNWHTVAWRSYPSFRGRGLMKEFAKFTMEIYASKIPDVKFWAVIKKENAGSIGFAQAIGFKDTQQALSDGSLIMIK